MLDRLIGSPSVRAGIRFAIGVALVDAVALAVFGSSNAALIASFAVAINLYFLDFDGDVRERLTGHGCALLVGCLAVLLGSVCVSPAWLAVAATFVVSSTFAYFRLLRGYVARSAVGLQGAFFLPLMVATGRGSIPSLLAGWILGCAISIVIAVLVLPRRRTGRIRALVADWLHAASALSRSIGRGDGLDGDQAKLDTCTKALVDGALGASDQPGVVGRRQRALAMMVLGARWSGPIADRLVDVGPRDQGGLAAVSADAFDCAAEMVVGGRRPQSIPDLPSARRQDLHELASLSAPEVRGRYVVRLVSIAAMNQLFNAARSRGWDAPEPDVGRLATQRPLAVLRENLRLGSVWVQNAVRTGMGAAACVAIVRAMGLTHGVWVVIAALVVTQVSLSGSSGATTMAKVVFGSTAGVLLAGAISMLHLPYPVLVVLLPVAAFIAKWRSSHGMWEAQLVYAPFALVNFAVLAWPPHAGLEIVRAENVMIGAVVAAAFSLLVFPSGVSRLLDMLQSRALRSSEDYLTLQVDALLDDRSVGSIDRDTVLNDIGVYETAVDAALLHGATTDAGLLEHEHVSSLAHDFLIGGDACAEIGRSVREDPQLRPVARELAGWWAQFRDALLLDR